MRNGPTYEMVNKLGAGKQSKWSQMFDGRSLRVKMKDWCFPKTQISWFLGKQSLNMSKWSHPSLVRTSTSDAVSYQTSHHR